MILGPNPLVQRMRDSRCSLQFGSQMPRTADHHRCKNDRLMNRRMLLISSVSLGLLLGVTTLVILTCDNRGSKVTVTFANAEASNGQFPSYIRSERVDFAVRNAGSKPAFADVSDIEDEHGNWVPSFHILGDVKAGQSTQFYLYLPLGSHPRSLRMRVSETASVVQKTQFALGLLIEKASGRHTGKQVWFSGLKMPVYEVIVKVAKTAEQKD